MSCACTYPLDDHRYYKEGILFFPQDYEEGVYNPHIEDVVEDGKKYKMVLYREPPPSITPKKHLINSHIVYACGSNDGKQMKCERGSLFYVLHPIKEWEGFHELR